MAYKVIDISAWQKNVDYQSVKNDGVEGVILRVGVTGYGKSKTKSKDKLFEEHYNGFKKVGLPIIGVYYYSCAYDEAEARLEADKAIEYLGNKDVKWIWFDTEDNHNVKDLRYAPKNQVTIGKTQLTKVALAFLNRVESKGYNAGIYASTSWLNNQLDMSKLSGYDVWVAQYNTSVTYKGKYTIWQYSSKGKVKGMSGYIDMNHCYKNYFDEEFEQPKPPVSIKKRYLYLSKLVNSWRVYPLNKPCRVGYEIGKLAPKRYGGLKYEILEDLGNGCYVINTSSFGKVKIYAGLGTLKSIREE